MTRVRDQVLEMVPSMMHLLGPSFVIWFFAIVFEIAVR